MGWDWVKKHHSPALPHGSLWGAIPYNLWQIKGHPNVACSNENGTSPRTPWTDTWLCSADGNQCLTPEKPSVLPSWLPPLLPSAQVGSGAWLCSSEVSSPSYLPPLHTKLCSLPTAKLLVKLELELLIFGHQHRLFPWPQ